MAVLKEAFVLCRLPCEEELVGVCNGSKDDQVIVSCRSKGISIFKISNQKLLHCWSPRQVHTITAPVLWDTANEQLIAVHNSKVVRRWTLEEMDFEEAKKKNVNELIYRIFSLASGHVVIIYNNGVVELLGESESCDSSLSESEELKWCWAGTMGTKLSVFLITKAQGNHQLTLWMKYYLTDTNSWISTTMNLPNSEGSLLDCCCIDNERGNIVFTLWSSRNIFRTHMAFKSVPTTKKLYSLSSVSAKSAAMVTLSSSHFAVAPVEKNEQDGVGIFDVHFGTMTTWQPLPNQILTRPKLFCSNGHLFTACDKMLYTYAFELQPCSLSNLLCNTDQLAHDQHLLQITPSHILWAIDNDKSKELPKDDDVIQDLFTKLFDSQKMQNRSMFQSLLDQLLQLLSHDSNQHWWNSVHMIKLIVCCCSNHSLWSWQQTYNLIDPGHLPIICLPDLFNSLISNKEVSLVDLAVRKLSIIPEISLANIIKFYLSIDQPENNKLYKNGIEEMEIDQTECSDTFDNCPVSSQSAAYLCELLSCSFNDIYLVDAMKLIPFKHVMVLLKFLNYQLLQASVLTKTDVSNPTMTQIVDWISVTLDAHVTQMVVSPDTKELLSQLYGSIGREVQFVNQLSCIEAHLTQLEVRNAFVNKKEEVGEYCIRTLHIP